MHRGARVGWRARGYGRWAGPGFSLLELLITIALIAALMILVYGGNSRSRQQKKIRACAANLAVIHTALQLYANDHAGAFPEVANRSGSSDEPMSLLVPQYTSLTAPFICPGSRDRRLPEGQPLKGRRISYSYYMGGAQGGPSAPLLSDWQVDTRLKVPGDPLFSPNGKPPGNNHAEFGGNILFEDGRVEKSPPQAAVPLPLEPDVVLLNP